MQLYSCQGLSTATYGSHGKELLYVHIANSLHSSCTTGGVPAEISFPRIHGLKVTGDANVCAGRNSFVVDINQSIDPSLAIAEFEARSFPIIRADTDGVYAEVNLRTERLHKIAGWFKGSGQINRDPHNPKYEWIGCHLVLYRDSDSSDNRNLFSQSSVTNSSAAVIYSIVWDDTDALFHHMMDFSRPPSITTADTSQYVYPFPVKQQQCGGIEWSTVPSSNSG